LSLLELGTDLVTLFEWVLDLFLIFDGEWDICPQVHKTPPV